MARDREVALKREVSEINESLTNEREARDENHLVDSETKSRSVRSADELQAAQNRVRDSIFTTVLFLPRFC